MAFQSPEVKPDPTANQWQALLEDDHAQFWDVYIGAPHATVKDLDGVDPNSDEKNS